MSDNPRSPDSNENQVGHLRLVPKSEVGNDELFELSPIESGDKPDIEFVEMDQARVMLAQMAALGKPVIQIAETLGKSEHWVRLHKKDPEVKAIIMELQREALEHARYALTYGSAKAADTMCGLLQDSNPGIQLSAAKDILDRLGLKAVERKEIIANVNINMDPDERKKQLLERFKRLELVD